MYPRGPVMSLNLGLKDMMAQAHLQMHLSRKSKIMCQCYKTFFLRDRRRGQIS
jgi:hypothetical protein